MKTTKTITITIDIKGQTITLTEAEARALAASLNRELGIPEKINIPPTKIPEPREDHPRMWPKKHVPWPERFPRMKDKYTLRSN